MSLKGDKYYDARKALTMWLFFGVILALVPFLMSAIILHLKTNELVTHELWKQGELLLLAVAMTTAALGNLIASENKNGNLRIVFGCLCIVAVIATTICYGLILAPPIDIDPTKIATVSPTIYLFCVLTSGSSVIIAET